MLRQNGVSFFLGAGASMEMGFPSGAQLKRQIACRLRQPDRNHLGRTLLRAYPESRDKIRAFGHDLSACTESSIDEFLLHRKEYHDVGRMAVWLRILAAEKRARDKDLRHYWLYRFLDEFLGDTKHPEDLYPHDTGSSSGQFIHGLTIHTLNYDRLAEYTVTTWIKNRIPYLDLTKGNYEQNLNPGALIRHPHGALGPLFGAAAVPFGSELPSDSAQLRRLASGLKFWFEPNNSSYAYGITNRLMELRGVHVITGFGYHEMIGARFASPKSADANLDWVIATSSADVERKADDWLTSVYGAHGVRVTHLTKGARCEDAMRMLWGRGVG